MNFLKFVLWGRLVLATLDGELVLATMKFVLLEFVLWRFVSATQGVCASNNEICTLGIVIWEFVLATQRTFEICTFGKINTGNTRWGVGASNNGICAFGICTNLEICIGNTGSLC